MGLHDFLADRIAEDAREADLASSWVGAEAYRRDNYGYLSVQTSRVLAEVEAKRTILELHADLHECPGVGPGGWDGVADRDQPCPTLRHLAAVYADHAGYNPEWAPQQ